MTTYVAFTTPPSFRQDSDELLEKLNAGTTEPQAKNAVKVADVFVESMMKAFIFDFMEAVQLKPMTEKIMNQLGQLIMKTANTLLDKVVSRLPNEELVELVTFFEERRLLVGEEMYLVYPLPGSSAASLKKCIEEIEAGHGYKVKDEFHDGMQEFADLALQYYMQEPMGMLKLGRIMRKIVDVAYATISKAEKAALKRILRNMDDREMREFAAYLKTLLLDHD